MFGWQALPVALARFWQESWSAGRLHWRPVVPAQLRRRRVTLWGASLNPGPGLGMRVVVALQHCVEHNGAVLPLSAALVGRGADGVDAMGNLMMMSLNSGIASFCDGGSSGGRWR
jgi:hypothetical protein